MRKYDSILKQISEKGLSVASNALASMGIASIALANMNNQKSQENLFINEIDIQNRKKETCNKTDTERCRLCQEARAKANNR